MNKHLWEEILQKENTLNNWLGYLDWCLDYGILLEEFHKPKEAYDLFDQALHICQIILQFQENKRVVSCMVVALECRMKNVYHCKEETEPLEYLQKSITSKYKRDLLGTKFGQRVSQIQEELEEKYPKYRWREEDSMFSGEGMELLEGIFEFLIEPQIDVEDALEKWSKERWQKEIETALTKMDVTKEQVNAIWGAVDILVKDVHGELVYKCKITEYEQQMEQKWKMDKNEENTCKYLFWIENCALHHGSISWNQPITLMQYKKKLLTVLQECAAEQYEKIQKRTDQTFALLKALEQSKEVSVQLLECKRDLQSLISQER